jgi:hypothetical protein
VARGERPWAVVITTVVSALVAAGAVAASAALRDRGTAAEATEDTTTHVTPGVGVDGCLVPPCKVLATANVGGTSVELVADKGGTSGRLRIGGAGSSEVIEATITGMGAILGPESLQCVAGSLSACLVRGQFSQGIVGQVVVGRSTKWNELAQPFQSDAGYLAIAEIDASVTGPEVLVAQHACDRKTESDCATKPVYLQIFDTRLAELGCTRRYARLESLPDWPNVTLTREDIKPCG